MSEGDPVPGASTAPVWHILTKFYLPRDVDRGLPTGEQILQAALILHLPSPHLERLRSALQAVIINSLEQNRQSRPDSMVAVRLLLSERARALLDMGSKETHIKNYSPHPPSRGWGFFLLERFTEDASLDQGSATIIELFLYLEGERVMD